MSYLFWACQKADWQFTHKQLCDFVRTADQSGPRSSLRGGGL